MPSTTVVGYDVTQARGEAQAAFSFSGSRIWGSDSSRAVTAINQLNHLYSRHGLPLQDTPCTAKNTSCQWSPTNLVDKGRGQTWLQCGRPPVSTDYTACLHRADGAHWNDWSCEGAPVSGCCRLLCSAATVAAAAFRLTLNCRDIRCLLEGCVCRHPLR